MKEFLAGLFLLVTILFSPLRGVFGDDEAVPMMPDSINDDADPVGTVSDPGPGDAGKGEPGGGRDGKRAAH